ncbi:hypothetical protein A3F02_01610, partial [Candidatus Curtissbacteria bacterium RIFCSPHIGHO2_12_FULL_38_9b]
NATATGSSTAKTAYGIYASASGADTHYNFYGANISTAATTNYGINLGTLTGGTSGNFQISTGTLTSATTTANAQLNLGSIVTTGGTTNYGINIGAISGTGTTNYGISIAALTAAGTTDYGIYIGGLSGAANTTKYGMNIGAISGATSNNYGLVLGTLTGGTTGNVQIQTGAITITGTTNVGLDLGGLSGSVASSNNYGIRVGNISSVGTANYGIYLGTVTGVGTNYGIYESVENGHFGIYNAVPLTITAATAKTAYGYYGAVTNVNTVADTLYGGDFLVDYNAAITTGGGSKTLYGLRSQVFNDGFTDADGSGTHNLYGGYFSATGNTGDTQNAYGIYATASGGDNNYAGYFSGKTTMAGSITGAANTDVYLADISPTGITIPSGSTTSMAASLRVNEPVITESGTLTASAVIQIPQIATEGTTNYGLLINPTTTGVSNAALLALYPDITTTGNNTNVQALAGYANVRTASGTTGNSIIGLKFATALLGGGNGTVVSTLASITTANFVLSYTGTVTNTYGISVDAPTYSSGTPVLTTVFGINIANQSHASSTNVYGIYVADQTSASTNDYGIYIAGGDTAGLYVGGGKVFFNSGVTNSNTGQYLCINTTTYEVGRNNTACSASSARFKENIDNLNYGLDDILNLRPVTFNFRPEMNMGSDLQVGFIAEEVEGVIPELVSYDSEGLPSGVNYPNMTALLTKGIQQLNVKVDNLNNTVTGLSLNQENKSLESFGNLQTAGTIDAVNGSISSQMTVDSSPTVSTANSGPQAENPTDQYGILSQSMSLDGQILTADQIRVLVADEVDKQLADKLANIAPNSPTAQQPGSLAEATASAEATSSAQLLAETDKTLAELDKLLATTDLTLDTLTVNGPSRLAATQVAGTLSQDGTLVIDYGRQINVLGSALYLQNDALAGCPSLQRSLLGKDCQAGLLVDIGSGAATIDKDGNLILKGSITAQRLTTNELEIETSQENNQTVGTASLIKGQSTITIETRALKPGAKVLVTPTTSTSGKSLYVAQKIEFEGFTVTLDGGTAQSDIQFDWLIINTRQISEIN